MENIDFLSSSPSFSIFQKKSNKIKFGGVIFLFYIIIMAFISLLYILDYILNEKFEIESSVFYTFRRNDFIEKKDERSLNKIPEIKINFLIYSTTFEFYPNNMFLKTTKGEYIKPQEYDLGGIPSINITRQLPELKTEAYELIYKCPTNNCSASFVSESHFLSIIKNKFYIDNYAKFPFQFSNNLISEAYDHLRQNQTLYFKLKWSSIIYQDIKGISRLFDRFFDIQNEYNVGFVYSYESEYIPNYYSDANDTELVLAYINNELDERSFQYRRKEIGFMDILAKIGALFSTFNFFFATVFKFYEYNFNNYKIVDKILLTNNINKPDKNKNEIFDHLKDINNNKNNLENVNIPLLTIKDNNQDQEGFNKEISPITSEEELDEKQKEIDIKDDDINKEKEQNRILPKISFFHYFLNNIYCQCCRKNKKQELINMCNKIVLKYTSIDNVLRNQIILGNLLKDYKWNDPSLNNINNNEFIIQLKNNI